MTKFIEAREKYRPSKVKLLFVTEAPPPEERNRYFYFEKVRRGDSLFLEMMKVLFAEEVAAFETVRQLRAEKSYFLERFQEEGFFLMHGHDSPLPNTTATARTNVYRENVPELIQKILLVASPNVPIVLISAVIFRGVAEPLRKSGFRVIHNEMIEFPNSGQQLNFRRKLRPLLMQKGYLPAAL
ncbi:hypothetical protein [Tunicatimonas pelagia]|uniref:hypothetical protein n=1 Tax=Tunicatimonas pelagia TaxID=931531 RepID=UPI0026662F09|nr:hypothetical protein [Tunicatimonas pelagia]WKN44681.1 hypothetical protein P0M28_06850 [Tunicatimonas pelagia]